MTISSQQIITALIAEHEHYLADCPDDDDMSLADYTAFVNTLSYDELVAETSTDDSYPLADFVYAYSK